MEVKKSKIIKLKSIKGYRSLVSDEMKSQNRTARLNVWLTPKVFNDLAEVWPKRGYPHPEREGYLVAFRSRADYLEFCIKCLNQADKKLFGKPLWWYFSNMLNPDFKEK